MKKACVLLFLIGCLSVHFVYADTPVVEDKSVVKATTRKKNAQHLTTKKCDMAIELLGECAGSDLPCDDNSITSYLPSAPRSTYVYLTKQKGFSEKNFTEFCIQLCKTPSLELEDDLLKAKICKY